MSKTTPNYKFIKPELNDPANIETTNPNWDTLDTELKKKIDSTVLDEKLELKVDKSSIGQPNGVCPLGKDGKIPLEYGGGVPITLTANVEDGSEVTTTNGEVVLTEKSNGTAVFNLPKAGTWSTKATKAGKTTNTVTTNVIDKYDVSLEYFKATLAVSVESDSVVTAKSGNTEYTAVSKNGVANLEILVKGEYQIYATKNNARSNTKTVNLVQDGGSYTAQLSFIVLTVTIDEGSSVTVRKDDKAITKQSTGTAVFYLPSTGVWNVKATKVSEMAEDTVNTDIYKKYQLVLSYAKTYTVRIALNNSNPETACEYMDDAVGMTPSRQGAWDGSWANTNLFKNIKPCIVKNGVFQYYLNKNNLAQKETGEPVDITSINTGDVMIEIPKIGYRMWRDSSYQYVSVTEKKDKLDYCYLAHSLDFEGDCDKIYIGAFLGWNNGNKIYSLANKSPASNIILQSFRDYAQARGHGYSLISFYPLTLLQCLYLIKYKNRNGINAIGFGSDDKQNTGGTITKGEDYGDQDIMTQMCFLNIEDFWGNCQYWIDGAMVDDSRKIKMAINNFNNDGNGYPYVTPAPNESISGFMSDIQGTNNLGFIIKKAQGSKTTYYCDYVGLYAHKSMAVFGGGYLPTGRLSAFSLSVGADPNFSNNYTSCRLMFKHKKEA